MNIVVTGASSGIGFQISSRLAATAGNQVIALSRSSEKLARLKAESLRENPNSTLHVIACDIADEQSISTATSQIKSQFKQVDILVNNAGLLVNKPFEEITLKEWTDVYSTNVFGAANVIRNMLPLMKSGSHILNISSMGGVQGSIKFKGLSAYSSSKAALIGLTECLAEEFHERNIAVNCLALGSVQTEMFTAAFPSSKASVSAKEMSDFISRFALEGQKLFNGKIIPVANSTP